MTRSVVVRAKLEGAEESIVALQKVGLSVKGTTRKGVRAGAKVMQSEAERRAMQLSDRKGKAVRIKVSSPKRGEVVGQIGPSKKKFYLKFFETGTQAGTRTAKTGAFVFTSRSGKRVMVKSIRYPGMAARPWLRPAFDASQNGARKAFGAAMRLAIETKRAQDDRGPEEE